MVACIAPHALAQSYPAQPITLIVAFPAGGVADGIARILADKLGTKLGQSVIVENRGGAAGNLGARAMTNAPADGYTLLVTTTSIAVNETLYANKGYSSDDVRAVAIAAETPELLAVNGTNPAKTLKEFLASAKGRSITLGNPGIGTSSYIVTQYFFTKLAKLDAVQVPFQGGAPALNALAGSHIEILGATLPPFVPLLKAGTLRGLAVSSEKRMAALPDVPTYQESGFRGFVATSWVGVFAPAKTSDAIVNKLNATINDVLKMPDVQERMKTIAFEPRSGDVADANKYFKAEIANWGNMVHAVGASVQ
jgi:tripartite-type tricarboxylate transporter receptor subunit TctC